MIQYLPSSFFLLILACSSVPNFIPSSPIDEAASYKDALALCGEYQILGKKNTSGYPLPERSSTLTPWIQCFKKVLLRFPESMDNTSFVQFYRALQNKQESIYPVDAQVISWPALNFVVKGCLEHIQKPHLPFSKEQKLTIEKELPSYALYLSENLKDQSTPPTYVLKDEQILQFKKELEQNKLAKNIAKTKKLLPSQIEYCKKYNNYRELITNLEDLSMYKTKLEDNSYLDPNNKADLAMKTKIEKRIKEMKKEAIQKNLQLKEALKNNVTNDMYCPLHHSHQIR